MRIGDWSSDVCSSDQTASMRPEVLPAGGLSEGPVGHAAQCGDIDGDHDGVWLVAIQSAFRIEQLLPPCAVRCFVNRCDDAILEQRRANYRGERLRRMIAQNRYAPSGETGLGLRQLTEPIGATGECGKIAEAEIVGA